jgi:hypothetical protein
MLVFRISLHEKGSVPPLSNPETIKLEKLSSRADDPQIAGAGWAGVLK